MKANEQVFNKVDVFKETKQMMEAAIGPVKSLEIVKYLKVMYQQNKYLDNWSIIVDLNGFQHMMKWM